MHASRMTQVGMERPASPGCRISARDVAGGRVRVRRCRPLRPMTAGGHRLLETGLDRDDAGPERQRAQRMGPRRSQPAAARGRLRAGRRRGRARRGAPRSAGSAWRRPVPAARCPWPARAPRWFALLRAGAGAVSVGAPAVAALGRAARRGSGRPWPPRWERRAGAGRRRGAPARGHGARRPARHPCAVRRQLLYVLLGRRDRAVRGETLDAIYLPGAWAVGALAIPAANGVALLRLLLDLTSPARSATCSSSPA